MSLYVATSLLLILALIILVPTVSFLRRRAIARQFGALALTVSPDDVPLGGRLTLAASVVPLASLAVGELAVLVECEEYQTRGDTNRTTSESDSHVTVVYRRDLAHGRIAPPGLPDWSAEVTLPATALPSFRAPSNRVSWRAVLVVQPEGRRALRRTAPFTVRPVVEGQPAAVLSEPVTRPLLPCAGGARCEVTLTAPAEVVAGTSLDAVLEVTARADVRLPRTRVTLLWRAEGGERVDEGKPVRLDVGMGDVRLATGERRRFDVRLEVPTSPVSGNGALVRLGWWVRVDLDVPFAPERHEVSLTVLPRTAG